MLVKYESKLSSDNIWHLACHRYIISVTCCQEWSILDVYYVCKKFAQGVMLCLGTMKKGKRSHLTHGESLRSSCQDGRAGVNVVTPVIGLVVSYCLPGQVKSISHRHVTTMMIKFPHTVNQDQFSYVWWVLGGGVNCRWREKSPGFILNSQFEQLLVSHIVETLSYIWKCLNLSSNW